MEYAFIESVRSVISGLPMDDEEAVRFWACETAAYDPGVNELYPKFQDRYSLTDIFLAVRMCQLAKEHGLTPDETLEQIRKENSAYNLLPASWRGNLEKPAPNPE
jgi:hypothetical protein